MLLFYNYLIITDFDTDSFTARLGVLTEYLRTVGDNVVPNIIGYVSHVNDNNYIVSYFYTDSLKLHETVAKNEFEEQFDFASQSFVRKRSDDTTASVSFVGNDIRKFVAHADDGDVVMDCGNGLFDGTSCAPEPICNAPNRKLPLTEDNLNELVFNRMAADRVHTVRRQFGPAHRRVRQRRNVRTRPMRVRSAVDYKRSGTCHLRRLFSTELQNFKNKN